MKVLVVSVRGWHLGYLGCHGNGWISTPALDRLAAEGIVFDQHFADVPDATTARRTWRDGRHHFPVAVASPESGSFDLITTLRAAGVSTILVADGSQPVPDAFTQGWDEVELLTTAEAGSLLEQTLDVARGALEQLTSTDRWLLWVDLATLLPPWHVPADFSEPYFVDPADEEEEEPETEDENDENDEGEAPQEEDPQEENPLTPWPDPPIGPINTEDDLDFCRLQSTYAGAASYLDAGLGVLLEEAPDDCLVIVTADHGQALAEHGICGPYRPWLHDELIHIPLIMRLPKSPGEGLRVSSITQTVDLTPTLLAAFELPIPPSLHGHNLLTLVREEAPAELRKYACAGLRIGAAVEWCLRNPEWAYLLPEDASRRPQLYVKPEDRWEVNDVLQHHQDTAEKLEQLLRAYLAASQKAGPIALEMDQVLRDATEA
jgi:arylsulfatase A-like enzyme